MRSFIALLLSLSSLSAKAGESQLHFQYRVQCDPANDRSFPGVIAEVRIGGRRIRAYLLKYGRETAVSVGAPEATELAAMKISYRSPSACKVTDVQTQVEAVDTENLAQLHSPFLVLRPDQVSHPDRDIPFHLAWSRLPRNDGGFAIRYTVYFSNETDRGLFATSKSKSQALWGRRTDIEWIYEVRFDRNGRVIGRSYQSGLVLGMGHATKTFKGRFLTGTTHPVLYNIARHNVFLDRPYPGQSLKTAAAHPADLTEIADPEAREDWMWRNPWSFDLSDRELRRNGTLTFPAQDYLYVRMTGDIGGDGRLLISGSDLTMKRISLSRLGEDLWKRSDYTAFRIRKFPAMGAPSGEFIDFTRTSAEVRIDALQFLRLTPDAERGFVAEDVSALFSCDVAGRCRY